MKKILSCLLICSLVSITFVPAGIVNSEEVQADTIDIGMDQEEIALMNEDNSIQITKQELKTELSENEFPIEVADAIEKIFNKNPDAEVTVYMPIETDDSTIPKSVTSEWSSTRV